jgi:hypothetical protein
VGVAGLLLVGACGGSRSDEVEVAARRAEREVISFAQLSSAMVEVSRASYVCDSSDAAGGSVVADADGKATAAEILERLEDEAASSGWLPEQDGEALVLRKTIDGRDFLVVAPGSGSEVEPGSDRLLIAWNMDRNGC